MKFYTDIAPLLPVEFTAGFHKIKKDYMQKLMFRLLLSAFIIYGCSSGSSEFKVLKSGIAYKLFKAKSGDSIKSGEIFRVQLREYYEDSMLSVPAETADQFWRMDSSAPPPFSVFEVMRLMKTGDSAVIRFPIDTLIKRNGGAPPVPFMKAGKSMFVMAKIIRRYNNEQEGRADFEAESVRINKIFMEKDSVSRVKATAEFEKIAAEQFAGALKTANGTLVKIIEPGTGPACEKGKIVAMKYEGRLVNGTVFDGNINTTDSNKARPYELILGSGEVIPGWDEGIALLKKGAKAKFFIPASSGYGQRGNGDIPPYSNLLFDMEVVDVKNYDPSKLSTLPNSQ